MLFVVIILCCLCQKIFSQTYTQVGPKLIGSGVFASYLGSSVSVSTDGTTVAVGAYGDFIDGSNRGATLIYVKSGSNWIQQGSKLVGTGFSGPTILQGVSVALSSDGNTLAVGGRADNGYTGAAWVFTRSGSTWTQQGSKFVGTTSGMGSSYGDTVSLSSDGNTLAVGGSGDNVNIGAVWIYTRSGSTWTQQGPKLIGSGATGKANQGSSVYLSSDGNTLAVGGIRDNSYIGAVWVFTRSGLTWTQQGSKLTGTGSIGYPKQGISVSVSSDGNTLAVGGPGDNSEMGAVWVFTRSGSVWTQQGSKLVGSGNIGNPFQGISVILSSNGNILAVGGPSDDTSTGAVWIFTRSSSTWTQQGTKLVGSGSTGSAMSQGNGVSLSGSGGVLSIGGPNDFSGDGAFWMFTSDTLSPTSKPSRSPSWSPSTSRPSRTPSRSPSKSPSRSPSKSPSKTPSFSPSRKPTTSKPSLNPTTNKPSKSPVTARPSRSPSKSPTFSSRLILYSDNELTTGDLGTYADSFLRCNEEQLRINLECTKVEPFLYFGDEYEDKLPGNFTGLPVYDVYGTLIAANWDALVGVSVWPNSLRDILTYKSWSYGSINCNNWQSSSDCLNGVIQNPKSTKFSNRRAGCNTAKTILCLCQGNKELPDKPTKEPTTLNPTKSPSVPSKSPVSDSPTNTPTAKPTGTPTKLPTLPTNAPTNIPIVQISAGIDHTCAVMSTGQVKCWGKGEYGTLGDGTETDRLTPNTVPGVSSAVEVKARRYHTCARMSSGLVQCWGLNTNGQLGINTVDPNKLVPSVVVGISTAVEITLGNTHTCALLSSGQVQCWGQNTNGQLGDGTLSEQNSPVLVSGITNAVQILAGLSHTCARLSTGVILCWGKNEFGQLGDGTNTDRSTPVAVSGISAAIDISTGEDFTCAVLTSGQVRCWGINLNGVLGDGTFTDSSTPVTVLGISSAVRINSGSLYSCAILLSGQVICWGFNTGGYGDGTMVSGLRPSLISSPTSMTISGFHTCVTFSPMDMRCTGHNPFGQLGDGTTIDRLTVVPVLF